MRKLRTIIIEDEIPACELLKHYLMEYAEIEVIAECQDGFSGLKAISEFKPDLIFLDIQMPKLSGFELLEVLEERPEIIFTTAYDQYAIKAFELNAVDYLLKPYHKERLKEAIQKAQERMESGQTSQKYQLKRLANGPGSTVSLTRIVVRKRNSIYIIPVEKVKYFEAQDDYVMIYHESGKALKQETMKFYDENLPKADFVRIHRSYIVNIKEIQRIEPYGKDTYLAIMISGDKLPVSRTGYKHLKGELNF